MRSSEEMGYAMYLAACVHNGIEPLAWEELSEYTSSLYVKLGRAALRYLFERGRICSYLNAKQLEAFKKEYRKYLTEKNKEQA